MDGGDRAGYKQISGTVDAILIGPSTGSTDVVQSSDYTQFAAQGWSEIEVVSSRAVFAAITAPGLINSSKVTSGTSWLQGAKIRCNKITAFKLSSQTTDHAVIAFGKVLL